MNKYEIKQILMDTCKDITFSKPILFIVIALIMDIIEPFLLPHLLSRKNLIDSDKFSIRKIDILFTYKLAKKLCLVLAIIFMFMQIKIFA